MRILAIDPGFERIGIAVLENNPKEKEILIHSECFKTGSKKPFSERLCLIGEKISSIIKEYKPEALAIEKLFFTTNQKTAMMVAEARGIIIYEAARGGLSINEYTPLEVKTAITSYGRAQKREINSMIGKLIKLPRKINSDDEMDAIAVGLTYLAYLR